MVDFFLPAFLSFLLGLVLTPRARVLGRQWGLVDEPDGRRKLHGRSVPVMGGPVLLVSVGIALVATLLRPGPLHARAAACAPQLWGLLLASVVICGVGIVDDRRRLRGRHKFLGQLAAVGVVIASGVQIHSVHLLGLRFELGWLAVPFTAFFLLGAINSLNLIDGMDGLLSSVALIVCLGLGTIALLGGQGLTAAVAFGMAGALLAFLVFNFPPASIFLGDSGSMLIGLVVGVLAIHGSLKSPATIALATPVALLTIPIFDTTAAILRRKLTGRSLCSTDRGHLHHCLLRRLASPRRVLLIVSGCCLTTVAGVLAGLTLDNELLALLSGLIVVALLMVTRLFGYAEFVLVVQRLRGVAKSLLLGRPPDAARVLEVRLQGDVDWQELWRGILPCVPLLNLCRVRLDVNAPAIGEGYHACWDRGLEAEEDGGFWRAQLPLNVGGCAIGELEITGRRDDEPVSEKITLLARRIQEFEDVVSSLTRGARGPSALAAIRRAGPSRARSAAE